MSVASNACTDLTLVLIGRPRCQGGPGLRVGSPEVGAGSPFLTDRGRFAVAPLRVFLAAGPQGFWRLTPSAVPCPGDVCFCVCDQRRQEPGLRSSPSVCRAGRP